MITHLSTLSSIATLILFLFYLIGKYFSIKKTEMFLSENINVFYEPHDSVKVTESIDIGSVNSEKVYITSSQPLRYIRFHCYDMEKNWKDQNGTIKNEYFNLKNNQVLEVNTVLTCGIPQYYVEYQRFDYVIGRFTLAENGKNGDLMEKLEIKHTLKSIWYHLVN